ncbi:MAG TPA: hypothetical protein VLG41_18495 [Hydrogenophaga sp.]|nr:hypothetical protein [Hydrogenophaga sp.]HSX94918.1 hypothetical protein [Hydrogenophaga sp.]
MVFISGLGLLMERLCRAGRGGALRWIKSGGGSRAYRGLICQGIADARC